MYGEQEDREIKRNHINLIIDNQQILSKNIIIDVRIML